MNCSVSGEKKGSGFVNRIMINCFTWTVFFFCYFVTISN
jgi:hypothetical protein